MSEIFEKFFSKVQKIFFKKGIFTRHTGSAFGGFFELVAIDAFKNKKFILPNEPVQNILNVPKICNKNEIRTTLYQKIEGMFGKKKKLKK